MPYAFTLDLILLKLTSNIYIQPYHLDQHLILKRNLAYIFNFASKLPRLTYSHNPDTQSFTYEQLAALKKKVMPYIFGFLLRILTFLTPPGMTSINREQLSIL